MMSVAPSAFAVSSLVGVAIFGCASRDVQLRAQAALYVHNRCSESAIVKAMNAGRATVQACGEAVTYIWDCDYVAKNTHDFARNPNDGCWIIQPVASNVEFY